MKVIYILLVGIFLINLSTIAQQIQGIIKPEIENQGVTIDFTDDGKGDTTLLFVHGWCINKSYWSSQVDFFKSKYRVVTVDLAGYGSSGQNRNSWSVEDFGKDVVAVIQQLDLKNIILVGHSMAGDIILESAINVPHRVIGFIGIDNFTDVGRDLSKQAGINRYFKSLRNNYFKVGGNYMRSLFYSRTDSISRTRVLTDFDKVPPFIAIESLEQNVNYSGKEAERLKALGKKIYLINSDKNPVNKKGFETNGIAYEIAFINDTGHFPMIEKPTEFNSLLETCIMKIRNNK